MIEMRLINSSNGFVDAFAPDWKGLQFTALFSNEGTIQVEYPKSGLNYSRLMTAGCEGALYLNGTEIDGSRFLTSETKRDDVKADSVSTIQGITWVSRLKEIVVYPPSWPTTTPKEHTFSAATAGQIMRTLLLAGQARGVAAANDTTWTFTNSVDSNGAGWTKIATIAFNPGTSLWDVLLSLSKLGMCDFSTRGRQLLVANPGSLGADKTLDANPVVLRAGRDLADSPASSTTRELATTVLVEGDAGVFQEVNDASAVAAWGRREGYLQQQGIPDFGTLTVAGQTWIDIRDHVREERTHELTFDPTGPLPFVSYAQADYVYTDVAGSVVKYLVLQIRLTWDENGTVSGGVTLNDRFDELSVKLQQRLDGYTGVTIGNNTPVAPDSSTPNAPTGLILASDWYADQTEGTGGAQITATWAAVTANTDASLITDLSHYEVYWRNATWGASQGDTLQTNNTSITWSSLVPGATYEVKVRAVDTSGHESAFSSTASIVAASDAVPPPIPTAPTMSNYLGVVRINWDGTGVGPVSMPVDFSHVEVHLSTVTGFTPSAGTQVDALVSSGVSVVSTLVYGTPYYAKLIAVDRTGNKSAASSQATATPVQVVQTDIAGNVIGLEHIQFKDATNVIPDGSFEQATRRSFLATRTFGGASVWSFSAVAASHGTWCMQGDASINPSTYRGVYLTPADDFGETEITAIPSKPFYLRFAYRGSVGATGGVQFQVRTRNWDGSSSFLNISGSVADGTWRIPDGQIDLPANANTYTVYAQILNTATTGTWSFDRCEVRDVVDSVIIRDAAITTAKIANLAVNDAKISSLSAGKITVGTLVADITVSARIKTADTGVRVELNSAGLQAYNSGGTQTVSISASTGNATITGTFQSSVSGGRVVVNPSGSAFPLVGFYPVSGSTPAYITADDPNDGLPSTGTRMTIDSGWNGSGRAIIRLNYEDILIACNDNPSNMSQVLGGHIELNPSLAVFGCEDTGGSLVNNITMTYDEIFMDGGLIAGDDVVPDTAFVFLLFEFTTSNIGFSYSFNSTLVQIPQGWIQLLDDNEVAVTLQSISTTGFNVAYSAATFSFSDVHCMFVRTQNF